MTRPGFGPSLFAMMALVIGAGSVSTWIRKPSSPQPVPVPVAIPSTRVGSANLAASIEFQILPSAALRPLGVLATAFTPQPLFIQQPDGAAVLSPRFGVAEHDADCWTLGSLRDACAITKVIKSEIAPKTVKVLIATLPDWVDSNQQWTFDPIMDAIQMSATQMGYVLVGFDMVDKDPDAASAVPKGTAWTFARLHELTPGSLLFRKVQGADPSADPEYLLILMVGETVTGGVLPAAFASALDLALLWEQKPIEVLGPTYSGSAISMNRGFSDAAKRHGLAATGTRWFDVVSGSASGPDNQRLIEGGRLASFRATTRSDTDQILAIEHHLAHINQGWQCGDHVALLIEANTTWGRGLANSINYDQCGRCNADAEKYLRTTPHGPLPCAAVVPFPMHISRLRDVVSNSAETTKQGNITVATSLDLSEKTLPVDRVPPESPELTTASVEILMRELFRALEDRSITAVGVFATDKRDHVYLAEEIARHRPNVLPFTIESNVIYMHPDVVGYLRGTLIASTYSLADRTQRLTQPITGTRSPLQFASSPAHGIYNALAVLMQHPEKMVDYATPPGVKADPRANGAITCDGAPTSDGAACAPPVWLSVVGRDDILPLDAVVPSPCRANSSENNYVMCRPAPAPNDAPLADPTPIFSHNRADQILHRVGFLKPRRLFLYAISSILLAMLGYQVWVQRRIDALPRSARPAAGLSLKGWMQSARRATRSLFRWPNRFDPSFVEVQAALVAFRSATLLIFCWWWKLVLIYLGDRLGIDLVILQWIFCPVAVLVGLYVVTLTLASFFPALVGGGSLRQRRRNRRAHIVLLLVSGLALPQWTYFSQSQKELDFCWLLTAGMFIAFDFSRRPGERRSPLTRWRRFPVLVGLAAFLSLLLDLTRLNWGSVEALVYADRTASIEDLVSPAYSIVLFAAAIFWWGVWTVRRIELLQLPEGRIGIGRVLVNRARAAGLNPGVFREPTLPVGLYMGLPTLSALISLWFGRPYVGTIDGRYFSAFLLYGGVLISTVLLHSLIYTAHLSSAVAALLSSAARHPGAKIFKRLGAEKFSWQIAYRDSSRSELEPVLVYVERLLASLTNWTPADDAMMQPVMSNLRRWINLWCRATIARLRPRTGNKQLRSTLVFEDWRALDKLTSVLELTLDGKVWKMGGIDPAMPAYIKSAFVDMEYIVFFHTSLVLRDLLARLMSGFTMIIGGLFILVLAHLFSTFEGRVFWLCFDCAAVLIAVITALYYLLILERDPVLSALWRTPPGQVSLFGGLTWRMIGYSVVSIVTLFAVSFPELAGRALDWLAPARAVLGE